MQHKLKTTLGWQNHGIKFFGCFLLLVLSCTDTNKYYPELNGIWAIKTITVDGKDFTPYLDINTFGFNSETNSAWFHGSKYFENDSEATWTILKDKNSKMYFINFKSKITIYNDKFKISMKKIKNQTRLELESKRVNIISYKIL